MCTILCQLRTVIVKPSRVYIQERKQFSWVFANSGGEDDTTIGKYSSKERAMEILEEIFKSEYYEMPLE